MNRALLALALAVPVALAACGQEADRESAAGVRLALLGRFAEPTFLTAPPGDRRRRFVVERAGRIRIVKGGRTLRRPFLDIADRVQTGGESGMLSMAFAPDYGRSRRYFVYFTDDTGAIRVEQYRRARGSGDRTQPGSRRLVIRIPHPRFNHKGGQVAFGHDGLLYLGPGDGGGGGDPDRNAQNHGRLLGKVLRIDPKPGGGYTVPSSNPFAGGGGQGEVFAWGLRNPYRFSFDRRTGALTVGDVGQDEVEEASYVRRPGNGGINFGWPVFEGNDRYSGGSAPGHRPPFVVRRHSQGACSFTGGYVIRDRSLPRRLRGKYVFGDVCDPRIRVASVRGGQARGGRALGIRVSNLVSFGEDARGRVYAVSLDGPVYRLARRR